MSQRYLWAAKEPHIKSPCTGHRSPHKIWIWLWKPQGLTSRRTCGKLGLHSWRVQAQSPSFTAPAYRQQLENYVSHTRSRIITKFRLCARGPRSGGTFSGNKSVSRHHFFFFFLTRLLPPSCPSIGQWLFGHSLSTLLTPGVPLRNRSTQFAQPSWLLQRGSHQTKPEGSVPGTSTPPKQLHLCREPPPHLECGTGWHPLNQLPLYRASTAYHDTCTICGQTCQPVSLGSHPQQSWPNQNRRVHTGYSREICGASGYSAQRGIVPMGPKRCI